MRLLGELNTLLIILVYTLGVFKNLTDEAFVLVSNNTFLKVGLKSRYVFFIIFWYICVIWERLHF